MLLIKKSASRLLIAAILLSMLLAAPAQAADSSLNESNILNVLAALEVMTGDGSGSLNLSSPVTRAEFTKMLLCASSSKDAAEAQGAYSPYSDVTKAHWAAGYVKCARDAGLINGYLDGTFRPDNHVQLAEALTMILKNLGYTEADFPGSYPSGQLSLYHSLQLDANMTVSDPYAELSRRDCAYLIYNMLNAKCKDGQILAQTLGYQLDAGGHIDYLSLLNDKINGPYVASADWQAAIGFTPATVYRNDAPSSAAAVRSGDVLYYSAGMRTVWAYNKQKTGTFEAAQPDRTNPETVTLSGVTYKIGSSDAAYALSVLGGRSLGESITVLLGRDDSIVSVVAGSGSAAAQTANQEVKGVVTGNTTKTYADSSGNSYTAQTLQITGTDGANYEFQTNSGYAVGALISVKTQGSGVSTGRLSSDSLTGTVNAAATAVGNHQLASDLQILDIYVSSGGQTKVIAGTLHKSRLAGARLNSGDVLYWEQNEDGAVSRLILNNFSGDLAAYGIMVEVNEDSSSGSYEYVANGQTQQLASPSTSFNIKTGPFAMLSANGEIIAMRKLEQFTVAGLAGTNGVTDTAGTTWLLADSAQVYEYRGGEYYLTTLNLLPTNKYDLRAYYDKSAASGGRVRIVIATAK